ncbi:MAG: glutaminase A [Kribbellaceae bacterium]|nr:glutaminase A [Kribbellaceae bacterium]
MDASEKLLRSFESLDRDGDTRVWTWELLSRLGQAGIDPLDPRVRSALAGARDADGRPLRLGIDQQPVQIDYPEFTRLAEHGDGVIGLALNGELAVSPAEFAELSRGVEQIYADLLPNRDGEVADYIPTLRDADPEKFGIAICTADGQVFQVGDSAVPFSVQSTSKPFSYAMALEELGSAEVDRWVGTEQSGGTFNDPMLSLDQDRKPRNPMINAGAIATLALVDAGKPHSERFHTVKETWTAMMGQPPGSDTETFYAEDETGDGNRQLAFAMAAKGRLKGGGGLAGTAATAQFYFQVCSLEVDAARLAAAGATLANGGVAPYSGERVFSPENTRRVLAVMGHSGMYDGSGEFYHQVGLPAKSGVSGNVMMVVPNRFAVVTFSPRLDPAGNSVRGVEVCRRMVNDFNLHPLGAGAPERTRTSEADRKAEMASVIARTLDGMARAGSGAPAAFGGLHDPAAVKTLQNQPPVHEV